MLSDLYWTKVLMSGKVNEPYFTIKFLPHNKPVFSEHFNLPIESEFKGFLVFLYSFFNIVFILHLKSLNQNFIQIHLEKLMHSLQFYLCIRIISLFFIHYIIYYCFSCKGYAFNIIKHR